LFFALYSDRKTDAHGDLLRGLQVVETSIGITSTLKGDKLEGIVDFLDDWTLL